MSVEIVADLKQLKLNGMATCYPELVAKSRHMEFEPDTFVKQLIEAETAERTVRSIAYQMGAARFPTHRDLAGSAWRHSELIPSECGSSRPWNWSMPWSWRRQPDGQARSPTG